MSAPMTDIPETELLATELAKHQSQTENLRRNGKIARLPKETRDMLNHMLDDGLPYRVINEMMQQPKRRPPAQPFPLDGKFCS